MLKKIGSNMYNCLLENLVLPFADKALGLNIQKKLAWLKKVQWLSGEELEGLQKKRMAQLFRHCSNYIPYYKRIHEEWKTSPGDDPFLTLKRFPYLDRHIIKSESQGNFIDSNRKIHFTDYTSGSSGIQGKFHSDRDSYSMAIAIQMLWWQWAGYRFGDKLFQLGISPKRGLMKGLKDILLRVNYSDAFGISESIIRDNLCRMRNKYGYFFMGYPSAIYEYAKVANKIGWNDIHFNSVVSWGDKLFPHYRDLIEKQFHTRVFDTYGACENTMIAAQCEYQNYHVMTPHIFLEILDENGNEVSPGEMGHVVVTRLDNYLMPLIRYKIGDLAVKADPGAQCPCGRNLPMLTKIVGRDTDIVYTPGGKSLIVHFFTGIFEFIEEIDQFQIVQNSPDDIIIHYVPGEHFSDSTLNSIRDIIYAKAKERFPFQFVEASMISASPSGKPQIIVSRINQPPLQN